MSDCALCELPDVPTDTPFAALLSDLDSAKQVLMQTPHAYVPADVAPISVGHCLIVPRAHRSSIGHCTSGEPAEITSLVELVGNRITRSEGVTVHFEHGMCDSTSFDAAQSCSITHAHLHIVQISVVALAAATTATPFSHVDGLPSLRHHVDTGYIYLHEQGSCHGYISTSPATQSQLPRPQFIRALHGDSSI